MHNEQIKFLDGRVVVDIYGEQGKHPIVFICGWGNSPHVYKEALNALSENFLIYAIALPGFGQSLPLKLKESTIEGHAQVINKTLQELGFAHPVTIIGHSTGGGIATMLAVMNPSLVAEIILVNPIGSREPLYKAWRRMLLAVATRKVEPADNRALRYPLENAMLGWSAKNADLTNLLKHLTNYGLTVHMFLSDNDSITPPKELADLEQANIIWVDGDHDFMRREPQHFVEEVTKILQYHIAASVKRNRWTAFKSSIISFVRRR